MNRRTGSLVNRRITVLVALLVVAVSLAMRGAFRRRRHHQIEKRSICRTTIPRRRSAAPFSPGIRFTYQDALALIRKPENAPANLDEEIKLLLDHVKNTLVEAGMTMGRYRVRAGCLHRSFPLRQIQRGLPRLFHTTKELPAREFIGVASLLRGGHFEIQAIAVRH